MRRWNWDWCFEGAFIGCVALAAMGCEDEPIGGRAAPPGEPPELVSVAQGEVQSGFATGTLRQRCKVDSFLISKLPTTWAEYDRCTRAGACAEADTASCATATPYKNYDLPDYHARIESAPALCVGPEQAAAYCAWIGGRLPRLDEWFYAARGQAPKKYAWGDEATACDQHPLSPQLLLGPAGMRPSNGAKVPDGEPLCAERAFDPTSLDVGRHPSGAAPSGIQDVLLAPGELLTGYGDSLFNACKDERTRCVVYGLAPAAIDSVEPFLTAAAAPQPTPQSAHAYAFRCVLPASEASR